MGRMQLVAVSVGAHMLLGLGLGAIPPRRTHEVIAITMAQTKRPKPPHVDPPPPPPDPPKQAAPKPMRAKTAAPEPKAAPAPAAVNAQASPFDALPDFGLSLSGGGSGGLAIPSGGGGHAQVAPAAAKVLARPAAKAGECSDPPAKPKLLSRPSAAYTDAARAAGISGKVRVEITVDEQGRVVSVRVLQGLGYGLDESALAAARALAFEPAVRCGRPATATFKIGFTFAP
jgi:periplasmic protein TonB